MRSIDTPAPGIDDLLTAVESLSHQEKVIFERIFHLSIAEGHLVPPPTIHSLVEEHFGSVEAVVTQRIVKVTNLVTFEGALFNNLRSFRPIEGTSRAQVIDKGGEDPLCNPKRNTPEDTFGRVEGNFCITASNIAKYDGSHGIVIFNDYNPQNFSREKVSDYLDVGQRWAEKAHIADPLSQYYLFIWNCLWRAGASLFHGHAQVMLTRDMHYAKIEGLRRAALHYHERYGSNYFDDLYRVHFSIGCGMEKEGVKVIAYLTPRKEREVILIADELNTSLKDRIYEVLECYRSEMKVQCFNLALCTPPLGQVRESWEGFPVLVRLVDRGNPESQVSDIGAMELFASSVISGNPLEVAELLKESLTKSSS